MNYKNVLIFFYFINVFLSSSCISSSTKDDVFNIGDEIWDEGDSQTIYTLESQTHTKIYSLLEPQEDDREYNNNSCCNFGISYELLSSFFSSTLLSTPSTFQHSPSNFDLLPNELIYMVISFLDPISVLRLSHVNSMLRNLINNDFWVSYNIAHNYVPFKEKVTYFNLWTTIRDASSIKIAIANYYYELGHQLYYEQDPRANQLFEKASLLGMPDASKGKCWRCTSVVPFGGHLKKFCSRCIKHSNETTKLCFSCGDKMPLSEKSKCYACSISATNKNSYYGYQRRYYFGKL